MLWQLVLLESQIHDGTVNGDGSRRCAQYRLGLLRGQSYWDQQGSLHVQHLPGFCCHLLGGPGPGDSGRAALREILTRPQPNALLGRPRAEQGPWMPVVPRGRTLALPAGSSMGPRSAEAQEGRAVGKPLLPAGGVASACFHWAWCCSSQLSVSEVSFHRRGRGVRHGPLVAASPLAVSPSPLPRLGHLRWLLLVFWGVGGSAKSPGRWPRGSGARGLVLVTTLCKTHNNMQRHTGAHTQDEREARPGGLGMGVGAQRAVLAPWGQWVPHSVCPASPRSWLLTPLDPNSAFILC